MWKRMISYLNTKGDNVSKSEKWFRRVKSPQGRVHHFLHRINVMKLRGSPTNKTLILFWLRTEDKEQDNTTLLISDMECCYIERNE